MATPEIYKGGDMKKFVTLVKLNNLEYNPNRDPEFYRRQPGKPFRIQALLQGSGTAKGRVEVEGESTCESTVSLPGTYECTLSFDTPGVRVARLVIESGNETYTQDIRLDVVEDVAQMG